ncbi:DivIVA domain-containing protein [Mycobacterium sp. ZZG]
MSDGAVTADYLRSITFEKPPWGKRGYNEKAVTDFLALCARRLDGRGHLSAEDVRNVRFNKPPFGKRGFNEEQVDALLAEIATAIAELDTQPELDA